LTNGQRSTPLPFAKESTALPHKVFGRMAMGGPAYGSATPLGIMKIIEHYKIPLVGKRAVVVAEAPFSANRWQ